MPAYLDCLEANGGVATTSQLLTTMSRKTLATYVRRGRLLRICHGVYSAEIPDVSTRLAALDLMTGKSLTVCMSTAAQLYGFSTETDERIHILDPGVRVRPTRGLVVHQRLGALLKRVDGRLATAPAWTAIEVARTLRRPRALATLDAALRSQSCDMAGLENVVREHKGRRGIVKVRDLLIHADGRAESAMESEARLVFIDGGLPLPKLQYEIVDVCGQLWRADFAWPEAMVVAEYDSMQWHCTPEALRHDRMKTARLQECGWTVIPLVVDDVRTQPNELVARIEAHLFSRRADANAP